jgi:tetratricopeptide (TPR) repeat protein
LDGKQNQAILKHPLKMVSNHTTQKRAEIMHNLGLAFYKLKEYEKSVNCFSEAVELYANKYSMWFWMGVATVKNYLNNCSTYMTKSDEVNKSFDKTILAKRPSMEEVDAKLPEKMRMNQAIRYLENVVTSFENHGQNQDQLCGAIKEVELDNIFSNVPIPINEKEELKEESDEFDFSTGEFKKAFSERHSEMIKNSYFLLVFCYCLTGTAADKALEYCKNLKSNFKLSSKMKFELQMYMAELYLTKGKAHQAFKCLRIDEAFEEVKSDPTIPEDNKNYISVQNSVTGSIEKPLPKRAIMFLNIATCNYFLGIPKEAADAISNALDSIGIISDGDDKGETKKNKTQEIPEYLLHSLVYLNLYNDDQETALKLLRKRRFDKTADNLLDYSTSVGPLKIFK